MASQRKEMIVWGIKDKYLLYAGIGCTIVALLYLLVFRRKKQ